MQLMGVVGKGEDFDHGIQDHHDPEDEAERTRMSKKLRRWRSQKIS